MSYRASFNDLITETTGVYKVYGISYEDYKELMLRHNGKLSGSGGNYTIYDEAVTRTYIVLYVMELNKTIKIDIRDEILKYTGLQKISAKFIRCFKEKMPKNVYVTYSYDDKKWKFDSFNLVLEIIQAIGYEKK